MAIQGYYTTAEQRATAAAERRDRISAKRALLNARLSQLAKHDDIHNPYDFDDSERYDR